MKPGSGSWLAALCASRVLAATWFVAYSAVLPLTQQAWGLSSREAGMVQAGFHLGYLTSLFLVGFIADHFGAKRTYVLTGIAACLSPWTFVVFAEGFASAFWLHAFTGLCQGGSYTPALALINDHVGRERRGRAMGYLIAGSSAGYALSLAATGVALQFTDWRGALGFLAALQVLSWLLGLYALRGTPNLVHPRPAGESLLAAIPAVVRNRRGMLSIWGYTAHNWELLGLWAWLPAFLTAALLGHGMGAQAALGFAGLTYVANIAGSILGGTMADRWGRTETLLTWSCVSLALSFSLGWLVSAPIALVVALACLYNLAAIADSSTHSTVLAESVPPHYLGVAYAVRSVIGFGAGVVSPVAFGWALDLAGGGPRVADPLAWGLAWSTLGLGALFGPLATLRLRRSATL